MFTIFFILTCYSVLKSLFSKVSQCQYKPCKNGATCIDLKDDFMCRCTTDYVGKICDRKLVFNVLIHCILFFINKINMSLTCICRQNSGKENKFPKKYQKPWATYHPLELCYGYSLKKVNIV